MHEISHRLIPPPPGGCPETTVPAPPTGAVPVLEVGCEVCAGIAEELDEAAPLEAPLSWAAAWLPRVVSGRSWISASRARATWTLRRAWARFTSA